MTTTNPTNGQLLGWHQEWQNGRTKNDIERVELDDPASHGKYITRLWRERLGFETEDEHPMVTENHRLRSVLEANGIDPDS
jgi:hypothetical protein